jgi:hypothetical protein
MHIKANNKERDRNEFSFPRLWFNTVTANFGFAIVILGLITNYLLILSGHNGVGYLGQAIFIIIIWALFTSFAAGPGEAFNLNDLKLKDSIQLMRVADVKKSIIYMIVMISILITLNFYTKVDLVTTPNIPVKSIQLFEIHNSHGVKYGIKYFDDKDNLLITKLYTDIADRQAFMDRVCDIDGKPAYELIYRKFEGSDILDISYIKIEL